MYVIKIGGGAGITEEAFGHFADDLAQLDQSFLLIHGGNAEFSRLSERLGTPPRMVTNEKGRVSRYTDRGHDGRDADDLHRQGQQNTGRAPAASWCQCCRSLRD